MTKRPTYAELSRKVAEFEAEAARRRRAEVALRASEARLVENLKESYFLFSQTLDGRLTYVSPTITDVLGYSQEEFIAGFHEMRANGSGNNRVASRARQTGEGQRPVFELEIFHKNGQPHWLEIIDVPVFDTDGNPVAVESIAHDVTPRKRAELSLLQEKNTLEAVFDAIGDGLSIQDLDFRIIYQNTVHEQLYGEHLGEFCYQAYRQQEKTCDNCPLAVCFQDGKVHRKERTVVDNNGVRYLEIYGGPIRDGGGRISAGFEIVRDVTGQKQLAMQVLQSQKMESVGRLARGIAHDFNNLLTGIISYADLSLDQIPGESPVRADLLEIVVLSKRAANLTRQLLAFSTQESGEPQELNINYLIEDIAAMLASMLGEDIALEILPAPSLGIVRTDPIQFEQLLVNLVLNAKRAMPEGGTLSIGTENVLLGDDEIESHGLDLPAGPYVMLSVRDTGVGMDKETLARLFDPFFTTRRGGDSSGLGLFSVYGIVKQHGGSIRVYSEPGMGSTFRICLPMIIRAVQSGFGQEADGGAIGPAVVRTILLVEDDRHVRETTSRALQGMGYSVLDAADPEIAEDIFVGHQAEVDLLLTDVYLPKRNGKELYKRLARKNPLLKVLYMTGYSRDTVVSKGILDADALLLVKPFSNALLDNTIKKILESDQGRHR